MIKSGAMLLLQQQGHAKLVVENSVRGRPFVYEFLLSSKCIPMANIKCNLTQNTAVYMQYLKMKYIFQED